MVQWLCVHAWIHAHLASKELKDCNHLWTPVLDVMYSVTVNSIPMCECGAIALLIIGIFMVIESRTYIPPPQLSVLWPTAWGEYNVKHWCYSLSIKEHGPYRTMMLLYQQHGTHAAWYNIVALVDVNYT